MLRLTLARKPYSLHLALGVHVTVEPLSTAIMVAARSDRQVRDIAPGTADDSIAVTFAKAIAKRAILDWDGVGDEAGAPLPVTPEAIDALLDLWPIFESFQTAYVAKGLELDAEKNGSPPSPIGSSVGARAIAPPAQRIAKTARKSSTHP
jgi:hypothetical protein